MGPEAPVVSLHSWSQRVVNTAMRRLLLATAAVEPIAAEDSRGDGLITIESDQQSADNSTGVVTASGNVRIVHANRGVVATSRQAQYFTKEERIVLRGDVDVVQNDGHALRADQVIYLLQEDRAVAIPVEGEQVYSQWTLKDPSPGTEP